MHLSEKQISSELVYKGKILEVYNDEVELENGEKARRDVVKHSGGVCVLAITEDNKVLFVKQYRYPQRCVMIELPAGKLEIGEDPLECGKRELLEETGYIAENYKSLGRLVPTGAYDTEIIYMYLAEKIKKVDHQSLDEDEFLDVYYIDLDEAVKMILSGEIEDAKTQIAVLKYILNKTRE